jgi:hypothetical protein
MLNSREMKVSVVRRDCEVWVARMPTGDFTGVRGEVLRWYLWALALHWPRMWWYDAKIAQWVPIYRTNNDLRKNKSSNGIEPKPECG